MIFAKMDMRGYNIEASKNSFVDFKSGYRNWCSPSFQELPSFKPEDIVGKKVNNVNLTLESSGKVKDDDDHQCRRVVLSTQILKQQMETIN
jgi:hypothetical protein